MYTGDDFIYRACVQGKRGCLARLRNHSLDPRCNISAIGPGGRGRPRLYNEIVHPAVLPETVFASFSTSLDPASTNKSSSTHWNDVRVVCFAFVCLLNVLRKVDVPGIQDL